MLNLNSIAKKTYPLDLLQNLYVCLGIAMGIYQIWSVLFSKMEPIIQMATHLSFVLVLAFLFQAKKERVTGRNIGLNLVLMVLSAASGGYFLYHSAYISQRIVSVDALTNWDILFGLIFVLLSMEAARRTIGISIIVIAWMFILYALFGHFLGGIWYHQKITFPEMLDQLAFSFNGLWGSPISVAASYVFIFVLFGAFLQQSGAGAFFFDLSRSLARNSRGSAGKIAVIASALMGMISGSPTANVVTTGAFTIPMAKKYGYPARFAAAIEACASTGGSFLPPIMGSSAFLMAAVTGIPYVSIAVAAVIPALLYYISLFSIVHLEVIRLDLPKMASTDSVGPGKVLQQGWYHMIPIILLVFFLLKGMGPSKAGVLGIVSIVVVNLLLNKKTKMNLHRILGAMVDGAKLAVPISTACAVAGIVVAGITVTGLGGKLNSIILGITAGHLFPTLFLVLIMCIILGMGMPVAAAYVLTAMLAAPTLINLGVSVISAHLFIVFFSIVSAITPPVAVAAFAAGGIAGANPSKVGIEAVRLGLAAFIVPFAFVYNPALLMDGTIIEIIYALLTGTMGVIIVGMGIIGHLHKKLHLGFRSLLIAAGTLVLFSDILLNFLGLFVAICIYLLHRFQKGAVLGKAN